MLFLFPLFFLAYLPAVLVSGRQCNGEAKFCDMRYSNVSYVGIHNSAHYKEVGWPLDVFRNQHNSVTTQLDQGIRFFTVQVHETKSGKDTIMHACHTDCAFYDAGPVADYFEDVAKWLDIHPDEVVTIIITGGMNFQVATLAKPMVDSGLEGYAWTNNGHQDKPIAIHEMPTLGELINNGTRALIFLGESSCLARASSLMATLDYDAHVEPTLPYIHNEFDYFFETKYNVLSTSAFKDCSVDRWPDANGDERMIIAHHYLNTGVYTSNFLGLGIEIDLRAPDKAALPKTNAAQGPTSIGEQAQACYDKWHRYPNGILVDFYDIGMSCDDGLTMS